MSGAQRGPGRPRRNVAQEEPEEFNANLNANMFAQMMHQHQQFQAQQAQQHHQMMMLFQQQMNNQQNLNGGNTTFQEFCRMSPPEFVGEYVPSKAREWIQRIGDMLDSMQCTEAERVNFATRFFRGNACNWWDEIKAYMVASQEEMNWENFKRLFIAHYIPDSYQFQMERELTELKQGNMSVSEYTMRFNELVRYAANGDDAPTEAWKIKKYRFGLRADIAHDVSMQVINNFCDLVQKIYHVEAGLRDIRKERGENIQKRKDSGKYNFQLKPRGSSSKGKHPHSPRSPRNCAECGLPHSGECMKGKGVCYYCKQPGHFKNECPMMRKPGDSSGAARNKDKQVNRG